MRSLRLFLLLLPALAIGISSCCEEDPFTPTKRPDDTVTVDRSRAAFVRIIHAASTAPGVVVHFDDRPFFRGIVQEYFRFQDDGTKAKYYPVDTATAKIEFRTEAGAPLATLSPLALRKGRYYTLYLYGEAGSFAVLRTEDEPTPTPGTGRIKMRVMNLAPGSPSLFISLGENEPPVVSNLAYARDNGYALINRPAGAAGLYISDSTGARLFSIPSPYIILPSDAVLTLVMTGSLTPRGEEPFLSFSILQEAFFDDTDSLYGGLPFRVNFGAVRFANLMPMGADPVTNVNRALTVSILDSNVAHYAPNEYFRRNFLGQDSALVNVYPLGNSRAAGEHRIRGYMLFATLLTSRYPWRVELGVNNGPLKYPVYREPAPGRGFEFTVTPNRRYTIIAYGDTVSPTTESKIMFDNTRAPAPGMVAVRFFHGGYDPVNRARRLKLRIAGNETRPMAYGELPDGRIDAIDVPAGTTTIELLDEAGTVVHTQTLDAADALKADEAYTIYLSRGAFGTSLLLTPVSERLDLVY